ncbi:MAG TPA: AlpA family phage regulatory protein [Casimicrobiaceae bacterium]|nr:AlpA family phage regulatory protein [Casimicrobiaceae bacterium]
MAQNVAGEPARLLRRRQVEALIGRGRSSIYEMIAAGEFPKPIRVGRRAVRWLAHEVDGWIRARVEASRAGGAR